MKQLPLHSGLDAETTENGIVEGSVPVTMFSVDAAVNVSLRQKLVDRHHCSKDDEPGGHELEHHVEALIHGTLH